MPLREQLHDGLDMVAVFAPVHPAVLTALPDALAAHLASPEGAGLRRRPVGGGRWGHRPVPGIERLARGVVVEHPPGATPAELALAAHHDRYRGLPFAAHVSGSLLALMFSHDLYDGSSGWDEVERILQRAVGEPTRPQLPLLARPVTASLRASGLLDRDEVAQVRVARRQAERSTETAPQVEHPVVIDDRRRLDGLRPVWIDDDRRRRLQAAVVDQQGAVPRATLNMCLTGLTLDAAAAALRPDADMRVRIAVDLRRYAPRGHRVGGPFSDAFPLGTLRTLDTSPAALGTELARVLATRAPLWAFVADMVGYARGRARRPRAVAPTDVGRTSFDLGVSLLPPRLPAGFWSDLPEHAGVAPVDGAALLHPSQVTNPHVQIAHLGHGVAVTLWDEAGVLDPDAFAEHLLTGVDAVAR